MRHGKVYAGCLIFLLSFGASASQWMQVSDNNGQAVSVDISNVSKSGDVAKVWTKHDFVSEQRNVSGDVYHSAKLLMAYNCKARTSAMRQYAQYEGDTVVLTQATPGIDFTDIVPDTVDELVFTLACGKFEKVPAKKKTR